MPRIDFKKHCPFDLTKHESEYDCGAFLYSNYSGYMDRIYTADFEEVKDFVHQNAMNGLFVEVIKYDLSPEGVHSIRVEPDNYAEEIEKYGDYYYEFK